MARPRPCRTPTRCRADGNPPRAGGPLGEDCQDRPQRRPRHGQPVADGLADIIRFRLPMIAAGYEDGNDADTLRTDPLFKLALERLPSGGDLCSQSTISRLA